MSDASLTIDDLHEGPTFLVAGDCQDPWQGCDEYLGRLLREHVIVCDHVRVDLSHSIWNLPPAETPIDEDVRQRAVRGTGLLP